jgi:hypothetical protein
MRSESAKSMPKSKAARLVEKQLIVAIDHGLASVAGEISPRRYVEWMTTSSAEIGRALKQAIREECFKQRRAGDTES